MNISVILSGGVGQRFGGEIPKQYKTLDGSEVLAYAINAARRAKNTDKIIVAADEQYAMRIRAQYNAEWVKSGETHNKSVINALDYIGEQYSNCSHVLFLDAVRPLVSGELINKYFNLLGEYDGVITAQKITDSLGYDDEMYTDRNNYYLIQKPEAFRFELLRKHFKADSDCTAIVQQLPEGSRIMKCYDLRQNMKITYPEDLLVAEQILKLGDG